MKKTRNLEQTEEQAEEIFDMARKLEGIIRNVGKHAAGVVIADKKLTELVPLYKDNTTNLLLPSTQFDICLLYTSPSPRDRTRSRMPSSA